MASRMAPATNAEQSAEGALPLQIAQCLRHGCVLCIQHADHLAPRFSPWKLWSSRTCYNGDVARLLHDIETCRQQHRDHFIRLNIEDYSCRATFSFVVHEPPGIA